jgi:hypothetical protein
MRFSISDLMLSMFSIKSSTGPGLSIHWIIGGRIITSWEEIELAEDVKTGTGTAEDPGGGVMDAEDGWAELGGGLEDWPGATPLDDTTLELDDATFDLDGTTLELEDAPFELDAEPLAETLTEYGFEEELLPANTLPEALREALADPEMDGL